MSQGGGGWGGVWGREVGGRRVRGRGVGGGRSVIVQNSGSGRWGPCCQAHDGKGDRDLQTPMGTVRGTVSVTGRWCLQAVGDRLARVQVRTPGATPAP